MNSKKQAVELLDKIVKSAEEQVKEGDDISFEMSRVANKMTYTVTVTWDPKDDD